MTVFRFTDRTGNMGGYSTREPSQYDLAAFIRFKVAMGKRAVARAKAYRERGRMDLAAEALAGAAMCRWTIKDARL